MVADRNDDEPTRAGTQTWPDLPPDGGDAPTYRLQAGDRATGPVPGWEPVATPPGPTLQTSFESLPPPPALAAQVRSGRTPLYVTLGALVVMTIAAMSLVLVDKESAATPTSVGPAVVPTTSVSEPATTRPTPAETPTTPPATVAPPGSRPDRSDVPPRRTPVTVAPPGTGVPPSAAREFVTVTDTSGIISVSVPSTWASTIEGEPDIPGLKELSDLGLSVAALSVGATFEQINTELGVRDYQTSGVSIFTIRAPASFEYDIDELIDENIASDLAACEQSDRSSVVMPAGSGKSQLLVNCEGGITSRIHAVVTYDNDAEVLTVVVLQIADIRDLDAVVSVISSLDVRADQIPESILD